MQQTLSLHIGNFIMYVRRHDKIFCFRDRNIKEEREIGRARVCVRERERKRDEESEREWRS